MQSLCNSIEGQKAIFRYLNCQNIVLFSCQRTKVIIYAAKGHLKKLTFDTHIIIIERKQKYNKEKFAANTGD